MPRKLVTATSSISHAFSRGSTASRRTSFGLLDRVRRIPAVDKFRRFLGRIPFVIKLFAGILAVLLLVVGCHLSYYQTMSERLVFQHSQDMWMRTIQTNTIIDLQLARIVDSSEAVLQERDVIKALQGLDPANEYEVIQANREVQRVLGKYFNISEWVYAYNIMSHSVKLGQGYVPFETLFDSPLGQDIVEANGRVVWYHVRFCGDILCGLSSGTEHRLPVPLCCWPGLPGH